MKDQKNFKIADTQKRLPKSQKEFEALFKAGSEYLHQGNYEEALDCFQKAARLKPENEETCHCLGEVYEGMGRSGSAKQMYRRVLEIDPGNIKAMTRMARILEREGDYHRAVRVYQMAIEIDPQAVAPRFGLALLYQHYDMFDEAREAYEALLEKEPSHPLAQLYLDRLLFQLGDSTVNSLAMHSKIVPAPIF
jgi:tetratricopeptide (TPR) repeat protein